MATLNQKVLIQAKLHKALHRNVYLLGLCYPMSNELSSHFKESMFEKPNGAAFHHLSYYLMSIIDPKYAASSSCWAMFEIKIEAKYRTEFLNLVGKISKEHPGHVSHIMASWIVNAGGVKVAKLMFELSQVALKLHVQRRSAKGVELNINELKTEEIHALSVELRDSLVKKVTWWHTTSINMKNISNIYQTWLPIMAKERLDKKELLEIIGSRVDCPNPEFSKQLNDIFTKNTFLEDWSKLIDDKISDIEINWKKTSSSILEVAKKCKSRSDQLVQMQSKQCKDSILQFDEATDIFQVPSAFETGLSVSQSAILKSNVQNGILIFPNLLKSYSVVINHSFQFYSPSQSTAIFESALEEKKSLIMFIKEQSKDLIVETFKFHDQLKEAVDPEEGYSCTSLQSPSAIYEILNFPSMNVQFKSKEDHSDYWCNCLEKFKFAEFKHPFKNNKITYLPEQEDTKIVEPDHSIIKKTLEFNSEMSLNKKVNNKPDYMKNIEELKRNMEIISDVGNKTCLTQHNMTTIGCRFGTERKQPLFSSNHLRNLLTSIKKKPSAEKNKKQRLNDRSFRKTWGTLFDESSGDLSPSVLQKTMSSPNLLCDLAVESKRPSRINRPVSVTERISGIREIDYSSFLSELGSTPSISPVHDNQVHNNISSGSQKENQQQSIFSSSRKDNSSSLNISSPSKKENVPSNNQHTVITETVSIVNQFKIQTFSDDDFKKPESTPPLVKKPTPPRRKSVESLIDMYKHFKLTRGIGVATEKKSDVDSKVLSDSFLERLDLGDNKEADKKLPSKEDSLFLSSVPDLLSLSLDYQNRSNIDHK